MNKCNCGICEYINDCGNDGKWEICRVNALIERLSFEEAKNEKLKEQIANKSNKQSKEIIYLELRQKYKMGIFKEIFLENSYAATDCWESCVKLTNHITDNYITSLGGKKHLRMASTIYSPRVYISKIIMSILLKNVVTLRKQYKTSVEKSEEILELAKGEHK